MALATLPTVTDLSVRSASDPALRRVPRARAGIHRAGRQHVPRAAAGFADDALPELVERLARQRLRAPAL